MFLLFVNINTVLVNELHNPTSMKVICGPTVLHTVDSRFSLSLCPTSCIIELTIILLAFSFIFVYLD